MFLRLLDEVSDDAANDDGTTTSVRVQNQNDVVDVSMEMETSSRLRLCQQSRAMLFKSLTIYIRDYKSLGYQVILPLFYVVIFLSSLHPLVKPGLQTRNPLDLSEYTNILEEGYNVVTQFTLSITMFSH